LFAFTRVINRYRHNEISKKEAVLWSVFWIAASIVAIVPDLTSKIAHIFGIGRGVDAMFYLSILFLFYIVFRIAARIEKIEKNLTKIVRHLSLKDK
jgi:hypothetical protein